MILAQLAAERLIHERVDGLGDADDAGEDDAPPVAVEAVGGGDGDDAEQDAHAEAGQAHVVGGDVLLERLHEGGRERATMPAARGKIQTSSARVRQALSLTMVTTSLLTSRMRGSASISSVVIHRQSLESTWNRSVFHASGMRVMSAR